MPSSLPLVSFVVMCYNQEDYIRFAIEGAFAQQYPNLEILISDDCSRDSTFDIVNGLVTGYQGPHKVRCMTNVENIGIAAHINKINDQAAGELIVVAAGDDVSTPGRTARIVEEYVKSGRLSNYFYSTALEMAIDGERRGIVMSPGAACASSKLRAALSPYPLAIGATQAWTKVLVDAFSPLRSSVWAEDQVLGFRGLLLGSVCFIDEPLVLYRVGSGISTRQKSFSIKRYFRGKISNLEIYRQRCIDAWNANNQLLALVLVAKMFSLVLSTPFHPLLSILRKLIRG